MNDLANFTHMKDGLEEDWRLIGRELSKYARLLPARIVKHLKQLEGDFGGFPVDRLTHSLQTASRAYRDGQDEEYALCYSFAVRIQITRTVPLGCVAPMQVRLAYPITVRQFDVKFDCQCTQRKRDNKTAKQIVTVRIA